MLDRSLELTKYSEPCLPGTINSPSTTLNRRPPSSTACWDKGNLTKVICPQGDLTKLIGTSADDTILESRIKIVHSDMCASSAKETIVKPSVHVVKTGRERMHEQWKTVVRNPKYRRGFIWNADVEMSTPSVSLTLYHKPLPDVPVEDYSYSLVTDMIDGNTDLFKVVTPIRTGVLEELSVSHPNREFVTSILCSFRQGFWPSASAEHLICKYEGHDNRRSNETLDGDSLTFMCMQRDVEIALDRYSQSFGSKLLPGMVTQPCFPVPKPGSSKFRLINDHTAGHFALNTTIPVEDSSFRPDNLIDLGSLLINYHRKWGKPLAWLFKTDVSSAYRLLPCHPRWQMRQATEIDGEFHIDQCCVFGNRASRAIWCAFYALVLWIGIHVRGLMGLLHYVNDIFSFNLDDNLRFYLPYKTYFPAKQVELLRLFDEIGIPHEKRKQEFGHSLTIIGLEVDLNSMTISMSMEKRVDLIETIKKFIDDPRHRHALRDWQRILGYCNWGLNAYPLLRPALQSSYAKLKGKKIPLALIHLNKQVIRDLSWFTC